MTFADFDAKWASKLEAMVDELCLRLNDYLYSQDYKGILAQETRIYEYVEEYLPHLEPDFNDFFSYIHRIIRDNEYFDEFEIEAYVTRIQNHIQRLNQYADFYARYAEEYALTSSRSQPYTDTPRPPTSHETALSRLLSQYENTRFDEDTVIRMSREEIIARAEEKKQRLLADLLFYIRERNTPVPFAQLRRDLPKITWQMISIAQKSPGIVSYTDSLFSAEKLSQILSEEQKKTLYDAVSNQFQYDVRQRVFNIYVHVSSRFPKLMLNLFIDNGYDFYNVLKALFPHQFTYSTPYIGLPGVVFPKRSETLSKYVLSRFKTSVSDLKDFMAASDYQERFTLKIFATLHDVLLSDHDNLIPSSRISLSEENLVTFINLIHEELETRLDDSEAVAIRDLQCAPLFPSCGLPWTDWLIYSVLLRYTQREKGKQLPVYVHTTSQAFSKAIPLVSLFPSLLKQTRQEIAARFAGQDQKTVQMQVDDLSNLDELIEDEIDYDWDLDALDDEEE